MASSSRPVNCGNFPHESDMSVYNCAFCNKLLNGRAVILDCLHIICGTCLKKDMNDLGFQCRCLTVSKNTFANYTIVSPTIVKSRKCDICGLVANKNCVYCKKYYCKPCSKVHLTSYMGRSHSSDLIKPYPMEDQFLLCPTCSKKNVEVYCTDCSVISCSLCHLSYHPNHGYKLIDDICQDIKKRLSLENIRLCKYNEIINLTLNNVINDTQTLENQKKSIFDEINTVFQKLHDELDKKKSELIEITENYYKHSLDKIYDNRNLILEIKKNNKYYLKLIEAISVHDKIDDFLILSKVFLKKLDEINQVSPMAHHVSGLKVDLKINFGDSLESCTSAIKNAGSIKAIFNSSETNICLEKPNNFTEDFINMQATNLNDNRVVKEEILSSSTDFDAVSDSSGYEPLDECSCCNQWNENLVKCNTCKRSFHRNCHIPMLCEKTNVPLQKTWKCTLCQDITEYVKILNQKKMKSVVSVDKTELGIMERILMELYCRNNDSEHFRELPDKQIYPEYYRKVRNPISLNYVKETLESNKKYSSLIQFLKDLKQVFLNGQLYYTPLDPYYTSAVNLQKYLESLINKWIPKLRNDNRLC